MKRLKLCEYARSDRWFLDEFILVSQTGVLILDRPSEGTKQRDATHNSGIRFGVLDLDASQMPT